MDVALFDFLRPALVPIIKTDITAGAPRNVHFVFVGVAAAGTSPNQLSALVLNNLNFLIPTTDLTVVGLGVELGIHDVVIDVLQHSHDRRDVVGKVGNFNVTDGSARRELLELALKLQFGEGVNLLSDVDMVAVGDVALVGDPLDDAEALLEALGELVSGRLDIIADIADIWDKLSTMEQAALANSIAGVRQQSVFFSLVENFQEASGAMDAMANSAGTLESSYAVVLESITSHINEFKAAFQSLGRTAFSTDFLKGFIDFGTSVLGILEAVVKLINVVGGLNTVLTTTLGIIIATNKVSIYDRLSKMIRE